MTYTIYDPRTMAALACGLTAAEAAQTIAPALFGIITPQEIIARETGELVAVHDKDWPVLLGEYQRRVSGHA